MEEYPFDQEMNFNNYCLFCDLEEVFPNYAAFWNDYWETAEPIEEQKRADADEIFSAACHIAFENRGQVTVQVDASYLLDISIQSAQPMTFIRGEPSHMQLLCAIQSAEYFTLLFKQEENLYELSFQVDLTGTAYE